MKFIWRSFEENFFWRSFEENFFKWIVSWYVSFLRAVTWSRVCKGGRYVTGQTRVESGALRWVGWDNVIRERDLGRREMPELRLGDWSWPGDVRSGLTTGSCLRMAGPRSGSKHVPLELWKGQTVEWQPEWWGSRRGDVLVAYRAVWGQPFNSLREWLEEEVGISGGVDRWIFWTLGRRVLHLMAAPEGIRG